jgi:hypothetical protein
MLLGSVSGQETLHDDMEAKTAINHAIGQFQKVLRMDGYGDDSVALFRVANAIALGGEHEFALIKYGEAFRALQSDARLVEHHQMRIVIPRQYAFALWHAAERAKWMSAELGAADLFGPRRQESYLEALDVTFSILGRPFDEVDIDGRRMSKSEEERRTANNALEYASSFLEAGGQAARLNDHLMPMDQFRELLQRVAGDDIPRVEKPSFADTVRKGARILGDRHLAVGAAERLLAIVDNKDFSIGLPDLTYHEMKRLAQEEIAHGLAPVDGYPLVW